MSAGRVNQALSGAIRQVLKDYFVFVAELEARHKRGELTLNKVRNVLAKGSNLIDFKPVKRSAKQLPLEFECRQSLKDYKINFGAYLRYTASPCCSRS